VRRTSLRAALLVLLGLDAFILGSLGVGLTTAGRHDTIFWVALVPLVGLATYLGFRTLRVWNLLRRL
jgi:hypothetical protein